MGVYIAWVHGENGEPPSWQFSIRGQISEEGLWPKSPELLREFYAANPDELWDDTTVNNVGLALYLPTTLYKARWVNRLPLP